MGKIYTLVLDRKSLDEYTEAYFKEYPRRRKVPIKDPFVPSLNKYLVMNKDQRNQLKERFEEWVYYSAKNQGLLNLNIQKCKVSVTYVFGDMRKSDLDNRNI